MRQALDKALADGLIDRRKDNRYSSRCLKQRRHGPAGAGQNYVGGKR
jgi:hypothetical protein